MLRQLCDSLSGVKQQLTELSTQVADANSALREKRERTAALEARTEEIARRSPPAVDPTSSAVPGVV
jgi:chromosome segregation ATPase